MTDTSNFGFSPVREERKQGMVNEVFARVASRYDIMNDVISLGAHRFWKRRMVESLRLRPDCSFLDLAGGTGDISMLAKRAEPSANITLSDINPAMLGAAKTRMANAGVLSGLDFVCANAEKLPFDDDRFDRVGMAFGIRNVTHTEVALREIHRVLKPGGRFVCLEFSRVAVPMLAPLYDAYSFRLIPKIGKWVANDEASYRYLVESIRQFPPQESFAGLFRAAGFAEVRFDNMTGGVVALHTGVKR